MEEKLDEILFKLEESAQALGSPPSEGGKTYLVGPDRWAAGRPAETVFFLKGYLIFFKSHIWLEMEFISKMFLKTLVCADYSQKNIYIYIYINSFITQSFRRFL